MVIMSDSIASYSSESGDEIIEENETNFDGNAGWANSISKILKSGKPKKKKTLVLSRAKKIGDKKVESKSVNFEIQGDDGEITQEKLEPPAESEESKTAVVKKRKQLPQLRIKPNILEKDRERMLSKIATKGVVQLFNAVKMQQKNIETQLKEAGPLEVRRDKVLKSIDKDSFFDLLDKDVESKKSREKGGPTATKEGTWNVLKDDFMLKAKYKDWDKPTQEEDEEEEEMEIEEEIESD